NPRTQFSAARQSRIRAKRNRVKRRKPHANIKRWRNSANALYNISQKSRAILEAAPVLPFSRMRAQKFVPQVSVAMLDIHEIEAQFLSHFCRAMKIFDNRADFTVAHNWIVAG